MTCKNIICKFKHAKSCTCKLNRVEGKINGIKCAGCINRFGNQIIGLGDLIALTINSTPFRRFKKKNCGCKKRQEYLNRIGKNGN
jgi:hypothetical protein